MCFTAFQTGGTPSVVVVAMRLSFRRPPLTYLRALVVPAALCASLLAAVIPPASALPRLHSVLTELSRTWSYFCSMLLGAAPFLTCGALGAATLGSLTSGNGSTLRAGRWALPLFALIFPGCDCSMNAYARSLRGAPPWLAACAVVWGSCCNPLALVTTQAILGPRMLCCRMVAGAVAAALTALLWMRLPAASSAHACERRGGFLDLFSRLAAGGVTSFAVAASLAATWLAIAPGTTLGRQPLAAGLMGALLSPCSSADAVLARVMFERPASQLAFMIAAQCIDVRQVALVAHTFGPAHAARASFAAVVACAVGCLLAGP